jgi:hypothetical protein
MMEIPQAGVIYTWKFHGQGQILNGNSMGMPNLK